MAQPMRDRKCAGWGGHDLGLTCVVCVNYFHSLYSYFPNTLSIVDLGMQYTGSTGSVPG